jgi:hypothetical protein
VLRSGGIEPKDIATQRYVSAITHGLTSQAWPAKTDAVMMLEWELRAPGAAPIEFAWLDTPGKAVREIFSDDADSESLSVTHPRLATAILSADIVLIMLNLADFVAEPDAERRDTSELVIKFLLNRLAQQQNQPHIAFVVGQAGLYPLLADQLGAKGIVQRYLPIVTRAAGILGRCSFLSVSSVQQTEIKVDAEGNATRLPSPAFESEGIDALAKWVIDRVTEDNTGTAHTSMTPSTPGGSTESLTDWIQPVSQVVVRWLHGAVDSASVASLLPSKFPLWKLATAAIIFGIVYMGCMVRSGGPKPQILSTNGRYERVGVFDYDGIVSGNVRNDGSTGVVTLQATWNTKAQKWIQKWSQSVPGGKTVPFAIRFTDYSLGEATYEVQLVHK